MAMERADWFTAIATVGGLGLGLYMSIYPKATIRKAGVALMALAVAGLCFWFGYYRNADAQSSAPTVGPKNSGIVAPGNSGIIAPGNSGIITKGQTGGNNTIINLAPVPEIKLISPPAILKRTEGTFDRYFTIEVV